MCSSGSSGPPPMVTNGAPGVGSPSKVAVTLTNRRSRPSGTVYQWRSVVTLAGITVVSPGDGDADAVAVGAGLGLGTTDCGEQAMATRATAHTHAGYLMVMSLIPQRRWIIPRSVGASGGDALDGIPNLVAQILR